MGRDMRMIEVGADYAVTDKLKIWAQYLRSGKPDLRIIANMQNFRYSKNGWAAGINIGKIDKDKPGSYEVKFGYYNIPAFATIATTLENIMTINSFGQRGWLVGTSVVLAKNIDFNVEYSRFKWKETNPSGAGGKTSRNMLWSYVRFYF